MGWDGNLHVLPMLVVCKFGRRAEERGSGSHIAFEPVGEPRRHVLNVIGLLSRMKPNGWYRFFYEGML